MSTPRNKHPSSAALGVLFIKLQNHEPDIAHLIRTAATFVPVPKKSFTNKLCDKILPVILRFNLAYYHPDHGKLLKINPHLRKNRPELMLQTIRNLQKSVPRRVLKMLRADDTNMPVDLSPLAIMNERLWNLGGLRLSKCLGYVWTAAQMPSVPIYTSLSKARRQELYQLFHVLQCRFIQYVNEYDYVVGDAHYDLVEWKQKRGETFLPWPKTDKVEDEDDDDDDDDW